MSRRSDMAVVNHPNPPENEHGGIWLDSDGNIDWDAYADQVDVPELTIDDLATRYWITLAEDGIHFVNSPEGCSPGQAREFAAALLAAAKLYETRK
jgi:hypothetical protein